MGAGQSVSIEAATQAQKEKVGVFSLRSSERNTLTILGDLMTRLLEQNNLFNLSDILNSAEGCQKLIMVLSSSIDKEFKSLRFPDPKSPDAPRITTFISKEDYQRLENNPQRQVACEQIAWFIIRLVTVVAALTASVAINPEMPNILYRRALQGEKTMNPTYKNPVFDMTSMRFYPIEDNIVQELKAAEQFKQIRVNQQKTDVRPLYVFGGNDSVVVDISNSIVYMPQQQQTGIMTIRLEPRMLPARVAQPYAVPMIVQQPNQYVQRQPSSYVPGRVIEPVPAPAPRPAPYNYQTRRNNTGSSSSSTIINPRLNRMSITNEETNTVRQGLFGAQRGGKRSTRRRRAQHGGTDAGKYYLVSIASIVKCDTASRCDTFQFYMDVNGNTFTKQDFENARNGLLPPSQPFARRMADYLQSSSLQKVPLEVPKEETELTSDDYGPLFERSEKTLEKFKSIDKAIKEKAEGASPASYRAFLLASERDGDILNTLFCSDTWRGKRTTNIVAYSLLQSLYKDRMEGIMENTTANECAETIMKFVGTKAVKPYVPSGGTPATFEQVAFAPLPKALDAFCTKVDSATGKRGTKSVDHRRILHDAHKKLRDMYDEHIKAVTLLILKMISFKTTTYKEVPLIILNPIFIKHERGSIAALEEIITEARTLLSSHYMAVEQVYMTALENVGRTATGNYVSPPVNVLKQASNALA